MEIDRRSHPFLISDTDHHHQLSKEQLQLLNRGPSYVPVAQMHVSIPNLSSEPLWVNQILILREQLRTTCAKYNISINHKTHFQAELMKHFKGAFTPSLPIQIQQRAEYEHRLIQSIHYRLDKDHLILRRMADQNT